MADNKPKMSGIVINITAGATKEESSVTATGRLADLVSDSERASFHIIDADLKKAIEGYFGKEPNYVYIKDPTPPYENLYKEEGWSPI